MIIGVVVGVVVLSAIGGALVFIMYRRKKQRDANHEKFHKENESTFLSEGKAISLHENTNSPDSRSNNIPTLRIQQISSHHSEYTQFGSESGSSSSTTPSENSLPTPHSGSSESRSRLSSLSDDFTTSMILHGVKKIKLIASGNFGNVWLGCLAGTTDVALKILTDEQYNSTSFQREVALLRHLKHQNIVQFYGITELEGDNYIVMEYMPMGSLLSLLKTKNLTEEEKISIIIGIAEGMNFLSTRNVVHRDLSARNVLVEHKNGQYTAKITDFGLALSDKFLNSVNNLPFKWIAPEVFNGHSCTSASDVWSFGVVLYEMFSQGEPYDGKTFIEVKNLLLNGYKLTINAVMQKCLEYDPDNRPTFLQIFNEFKTTLATLQSQSVYVNHSSVS